MTDFLKSTVTDLACEIYVTTARNRKEEAKSISWLLS